MDFQLDSIHSGVITGYIVLLLNMNDDAYREYSTLCKEAATLNAKFSSHSNTIQNPNSLPSLTLFQCGILPYVFIKMVVGIYILFYIIK